MHLNQRLPPSPLQTGSARELLARMPQNHPPSHFLSLSSIAQRQPGLSLVPLPLHLLVSQDMIQESLLLHLLICRLVILLVARRRV